MSSIVFGFAAFVAFAPYARAQVNAETLRPNPLEAGWSGGLDASLSLTRGNVRIFDVGGAARVQYQTLHPIPDGAEKDPRYLPYFAHRTFLVANGRFAERDAETFASQAYIHARWVGMWHPRVGTDLFAQFQYNEFWRLQARVLTGTGVRFEMVHTPEVMVWGGTGYMFEYNQLLVEPGAPDEPETFEHRSTSYLTARVSMFDDRLLVQNTLYVQPRFDDIRDIRALDELELVAKVTEWLGFGISMALQLDTKPPTNVRQADGRLATSIRLSL